MKIVGLNLGVLIRGALECMEYPLTFPGGNMNIVFDRFSTKVLNDLQDIINLSNHNDSTPIEIGAAGLDRAYLIMMDNIMDPIFHGDDSSSLRDEIEQVLKAYPKEEIAKGLLADGNECDLVVEHMVPLVEYVAAMSSHTILDRVLAAAFADSLTLTLGAMVHRAKLKSVTAPGKDLVYLPYDPQIPCAVPYIG